MAVENPWLLIGWECDRLPPPPPLGLHEGNFGLQPMISTWNPTWQLEWMMLVGIVRGVFLRTALEGRTCLCLLHTLGYIPWTSLWSHPKSGVPWSFKSHGLVPFGVNVPLDMRMHHGGEKNEVFVALFMYWCLYMLIWQVLSIQVFQIEGVHWI